MKLTLILSDFVYFLDYRGASSGLPRSRFHYKQLRKPSSPLYCLEEGTPRGRKTLVEDLPRRSRPKEQPRKPSPALCRPLQRSTRGCRGLVQCLPSRSHPKEQRQQHSPRFGHCGRSQPKCCQLVAGKDRPTHRRRNLGQGQAPIRCRRT